MTERVVSLRVLWRRTWQPKSYESEEVQLSLGGDFVIEDGRPAEVGQRSAAIEQELLAQLTAIGDEIIAGRLHAGSARTAADLKSPARAAKKDVSLPLLPSG